MHGKKERNWRYWKGKKTRMSVQALRENAAQRPGSAVAVGRHVLWEACQVVSDASESVFSPKRMLLATGRAFMRLLKSRAISPGPSVLGEHYELKHDLHQVGPSSCTKT